MPGAIPHYTLGQIGVYLAGARRRQRQRQIQAMCAARAAHLSGHDFAAAIRELSDG